MTSTTAPRCARIVYKFMENAAKLVKGGEGVRDMDASIRGERLWMRFARWPRRYGPARPARRIAVRSWRDQTISKSLADGSPPGVSAEVAPDPRNAEAKENGAG